MSKTQSVRETRITLRAIRVQDNGNYTFDVFFPAVSLTAEQLRVIETLFPNSRTAVEKLLDQELLLSSIASEAEIMTPRSTSKVKETISRERGDKSKENVDPTLTNYPPPYLDDAP
jgi:hypothetical protein